MQSKEIVMYPNFTVSLHGCYTCKVLAQILVLYVTKQLKKDCIYKLFD